jgi:multiple sugar transport system ATP-binding protein
MDVYENMAFGARLMGLDKAEVERRIAETTRMLRLEELLQRKPRELSGGQRQRVAIGRALVRKPEVFLLDEPLSNLDAALRSEVRLEIARLHHDIGGTMIYVTHDQVEAMTLADKIVVMNAGRIEQVGSPRVLYETPANTFVATFIGSPRMTLLDVTRDGERLVMADGGSIAVGALPAGSAFRLGLRSDAVRLARGQGDGFAGQVVYTEYLGDNAYVYVRLADGTLLAARTAPNDSFAPDEPVTVRVDPGSVHFFSAEDGRRLTQQAAE